jgi:hypothetical protein
MSHYFQPLTISTSKSIAFIPRWKMSTPSTIGYGVFAENIYSLYFYWPSKPLVINFYMASNYSEFAYTLITHVEFWPSNFFPRTGHSLQLFRGQTKNMWDIANNDLKKISISRCAILKCKNVNMALEREKEMLYFFPQEV